MDFQTTVIQESFKQPVVVDFWAPWCGPCRMLGPIIEEVAEEQAEHWKLVKVDVDQNPKVAQEYRVMGIPNVKMFYKGEVVGEFSGALPKPGIEKWLTEYLPNPILEELYAILQDQNDIPDPGIIERLEAFHQQYPEVPDTRLHLARQKVLSKPAEVLPLLEGYKANHANFDLLQDIKRLAEFLLDSFTPGEDAEGCLAAAQQALLDNQKETGAQKLIDAVQQDKTFRKDLPRKITIALFHLLGQQHPVTKKYRRLFDMRLY